MVDMRKLLAWFGVTTLCVLTSTASAQNDVLKPYVVLILDTSGSMAGSTGSGPTSCGRSDQRINHAVCAINNIVNSYGDMVFSFARFRETTSGTANMATTTDTKACDTDLDGDGEEAGPCTTHGVNCRQCTTSGTTVTCTSNNNCSNGDTCNTAVESNCTDDIDNDLDGKINDGCPTFMGTAETSCSDAIDNDGDGRINDGCVAQGQCTNGCTIADSTFEVLTPLVDGNNAAAAEYTNGFCNTCGVNAAGALDPEIWGVGNTYTPLSATLNGSKRYWQGNQASDGSVIWGSNLSGFDPINRDPSNAIYLNADTCDPSATCTTNCCSQCRPYINILLTDGDETCAPFSSTLASAQSLLGTRPHDDSIAISTIKRTTGVVEVTTSQPHPFRVGDAIVVEGVSTTNFNVGIPNPRTAPPTRVTAVLSSTSFQYEQKDANGNPLFGNVGLSSLGGTTGHLSTKYWYRVVTKVIGFGISPGDADIEALAHAGGSTDMPGNEGYYAKDEGDLQLAISQILADSVRSESCNAKDDDCDTRIDEDFNLNATCQASWPANDPISPGQVAVGICAKTGTTQCSNDKTTTVCNATPNPRGTDGPNCNGLDDDCDGRVDENLACQNCQPSGEACDADDDDCDTVSDMSCRCNAASSNAGATCTNNSAQCPGGACVCSPIVRGCSITNQFGSCPGTQQCNNTTNGQYTNCQGTPPAAEICNAKDDDCDGVCDGFDISCSEIGTTCDPANPASCPGTGNPGHPSNNPIPENICRPGVRTCPQKCGGSNQFGFCSGEVKPLPAEICNGLDDDCDNKIDEGTGGASCDTACGVGVTVCSNGTISCSATQASDDSTCDNKDDDCDNIIDEDWKCTNNPDAMGKCACGAGQVCAGFEACEGGQVVCKGDPNAGDPNATEVCNCADDNCNNQVDEGTVCPSGAVCTNCQCAFPCAPGEFPCPLGKKCEVSPVDNNKYCVNDPCFNVSCPSVNGHAQTCVPKSGAPNEPQCVDTCTTMTCTNGFVCVDATGECKPNNCTTFPEKCTADQSCINGTCVTNPCQNVTCSGEQYCVNGTCVDSCADKVCPDGQRCRLGSCETDPCGHACPFGQACNDDTGKCIEDPCKVRTCDPGQWCNPNSRECETDPCIESNVKCPEADQICRGGTCINPDTLQPDGGDEAHVTVGGGGGCNTTGNSSTGLLLALALLVIRRKRVQAVREGGAQ